jgi:hypothetical protein
MRTLLTYVLVTPLSFVASRLAGLVVGVPISFALIWASIQLRSTIAGFLKNDFRPHYCLEDFNVIFPGEPEDNLSLAIPMVSFCDIPLSQSQQHLDTYGGYGIGLTKEWAKEMG